MDNKFTEGLYPKFGHEKTPWIVARLGIYRDKFVAWLQQQSINEKGYLDIDVCQSKNDKTKLYAVLNTYQADKKRDENEGYTSPDKNGQRIKVEDIAF